MVNMFKVAKDVVGMEKQAAIDIISSTDGTYRIVKEDGKERVVTDDLRDDRVSMEIENGIVTKAYIF